MKTAVVREHCDYKMLLDNVSALGFEYVEEGNALLVFDDNDNFVFWFTPPTVEIYEKVDVYFQMPVAQRVIEELGFPKAEERTKQ